MLDGDVLLFARREQRQLKSPAAEGTRGVIEGASSVNEGGRGQSVAVGVSQGAVSSRHRSALKKPSSCCDQSSS